MSFRYGPNGQQPSQMVYVQYAPKPPSNGLAIAGMVLGIVGTVLSLIPIVGIFLCWLPALLGVIFGCIGLGTAKRNNGYRRGEAITAVICGLLPIPLVMIGFAVVAALGASSSTQ
ncbi:DUF4190 domain-containing protein [Diaminobutyricibacter tongyongensis]|uniref:DUF4190 domain-containing protein n=1 Tax=Leifsonia tongyongensis TaxID=1268043 RepID=A0A6L9XXP2_9MICO|nr:DUF4190 domain-containing protein [Diaminobutyricibacter tongyongensis]NEN06015.1 DUF4190 domain-containing protein [Diaminobutyricibacter tongyongensis]